MVNTSFDPAPLLISRSLATALLRLYDYPDPRRPGRMIPGYDRPHALRTARMCVAVATRLGHPPARVATFQVACLLPARAILPIPRSDTLTGMR